MISPVKPENESKRLNCLKKSGLLDTEPEERFDRFTKIACETLNVPIALICLIDQDRQWFKSCFGINIRETHRDVSFCAHAILEKDFLLIPDTHKDKRFKDNPLVTGSPKIRFYAGYPLTSSQGYNIGTFCIIDNKPRMLKTAEMDTLHALGRCVETEIFNNLTNNAIKNNDLEIETLLNTLTDSVIKTDCNGLIKTINKTTENMFGFNQNELIGQNIKVLMPENFQEKHDHYIQNYLATGYTQVMGKGRRLAGKRKNGTTFPIEVTLTEMTYMNERFFIGVIRDISEKEHQRQFFEAIVENIPNMVFVKDAEHLRFQFFNRAGEELLGLSQEMLLGKNDFDFFPEEQANFFTQKDREALSKTVETDIPEEPIDTQVKGKRILHTKKITLRDLDGNPKYLLGISEDITEKKKLQDEIKRLALVDWLTDIPNRAALQQHLVREIARCKRENSGLTILYIDLDNFKPINDHYGHEAGDTVLREFAGIFQENVRESDYIARWGGDEFMAVLNETQNLSVAKLVERLNRSLKNKINTPWGDFTLSVSFGMATFPEDGNDIDNLMAIADKNMYTDKQNKNKAI